MSDGFLLLALFFPRITLLVMYLQAVIPLNPTPFVLDFLLSLFLPRIMILILIAVTSGFTGWFWVHLVAAILVYSGSSFSYGKSED